MFFFLGKWNIFDLELGSVNKGSFMIGMCVDIIFEKEAIKTLENEMMIPD